MTRTQPGCMRRSCRQTSTPSRSGSPRSRRTRSTTVARAPASAAVPVRSHTTSWPWLRRLDARTSPIVESSSTRRMRAPTSRFWQSAGRWASGPARGLRPPGRRRRRARAAPPPAARPARPGRPAGASAGSAPPTRRPRARPGPARPSRGRRRTRRPTTGRRASHSRARRRGYRRPGRSPGRASAFRTAPGEPRRAAAAAPPANRSAGARRAPPRRGRRGRRTAGSRSSTSAASTSTRSRPPPETAPDSAARTSSAGSGTAEDAGPSRTPTRPRSAPSSGSGTATDGCATTIAVRPNRVAISSAAPVVRVSTTSAVDSTASRWSSITVSQRRPRRMRRGAQLVHRHHERQPEPAHRLGPALPGDLGHVPVAGVQVQDVDLRGVLGQVGDVQPRAGIAGRPHADDLGREDGVQVGVGVRDRGHPGAARSGDVTREWSSS